MDREGCRSPAGIGCMTGLTGGRYTQRPMVGVCRLVVTGLVTTYAGIWGVVVISTNMATVTLYGGVSA